MWKFPGEKRKKSVRSFCHVNLNASTQVHRKKCTVKTVEKPSNLHRNLAPKPRQHRNIFHQNSGILLKMAENQVRSICGPVRGECNATFQVDRHLHIAFLVKRKNGTREEEKLSRAYEESLLGNFPKSIRSKQEKYPRISLASFWSL